MPQTAKEGVNPASNASSDANEKSKESEDKASSDITDKNKDENDNNAKRVGLLTLSSNLLNIKSPDSPSPSGSSSTSSVTTSVPSTTKPTATSHPAKPSVPISSPVSTQSVSSLSSSSSSKLPAKSSKKITMEPETVIDLKQTLISDKLCGEFRTYLRKLDQNKSDDLTHKKMMEQWMDYVQLCDKIFELPETELETKTSLMIQIGEKFLAKPPDGYNIALKSQINRKELLNHCKSLAERVPDLTPNEELLKDGYTFLCGKLEQKHDLFKKQYVPTTTLAALLCSVL